MEEKKEKKTIKCSYAVLVIILFAALAFVTDYAYIERKTRKCDCPKCEATNNEVISDNIEDKDNTDNTQVTENKETEIESDNIDNYTYLRDTQLTTGCNNEINIRIDNGNIIISYGESTVKYSGVDAKYIHFNGFMECGNLNLFYLTNDNNLYEIEGIYSLFGNNPKFVQPIKKSDNVIDMIEETVTQDSYGDTLISNHGLKVKTLNGEVITVYWRSFFPPVNNQSTMYSRY